MIDADQPALRTGDGRPAAPSRRGVRHSLARPSFILPALGLQLVFFVLPVLINVGAAFTSWTSYAPVISFVGLDNFADLAASGNLSNSILVTLAYAATVMVVNTSSALLLAVLLQRPSRLSSVFRTLFFLPVLLSPFAAGYIWRGILQPDGPLNHVLSGILQTDISTAWLGNPAWVIFICALIDAWKWTGLTTLVFIAGLNAIPGELLEAGRIDGASAARAFVAIKLPLMRPAFTFNLVLTLIGSISAYDIIRATTEGGPGDASRVLNIFMLDQYSRGFFGYATSLSVVVLMLVLALGIPMVRFLRSREVEA